MANWDNLKASIAEVIKTNGNQEITGQILQNALSSIISNLGENATFAGVATPSTNPGTPDGKVFYLAKQKGVYTNFNGVELGYGLNMLLWNNSSWQVINLIALMHAVGGSYTATMSQHGITKELLSRTMNVNGSNSAITDLLTNLWIIPENEEDIEEVNKYEFQLSYLSFKTYQPNGFGIQIRARVKGSETPWSDASIIINSGPAMDSWKKMTRFEILDAVNNIPIRIIILTSNKDIDSYNNTQVDAIISDGALFDVNTNPRVLDCINSNEINIGIVNGIALINNISGTISSSINAYVDKTTRVATKCKLHKIGIEITSISEDKPTEAYFYIASSNTDITRFVMKKKIIVTPVLGYNLYDVSDLDITLDIGDCVIWGGYHKIKYTTGNGYYGKIISESSLLNYNEGDTFYISKAVYNFNFCIRLVIETSYTETINEIVNQIPASRFIEEHSTNLFNYNDPDRVVGKLINSKGNLSNIKVSPETWYSTGYVDLLGASTIIVGRNGVAGNGCYSLAFYDSSKSFISYQRTYNTGFDGILEVPKNAKYARFTLLNYLTWQVNEGDVLLDFEDYYYKSYYKSDSNRDGKNWVFKPDVNDKDLLSLINGGVNTLDLFTPMKIYTVCNDITSDEDTAGERNYAIALFIDHMIKLEKYAKLRFDLTQSDRLPIFSHFTSYGIVGSGRGWVWNEDGSNIKETDKQVSIIGVPNTSFSFKHISTRNTVTATKKPIVLCIGDSVTEGYLANMNKPYNDAPNTYWQWAKMFFDFDKKQANDESKYKSLFVGQRNVASYKGKYIDDTLLDMRACAEGKGSALLSQYLRSTTIGGATNYFYDADKEGGNKFSVLHWLKLFRTMDDTGERLTGSAGSEADGSDGKKYTIGTNASNTSAYDVCTPTHVVIQLGYNDGDRAGYLDDINAMISIIQEEIPGCIVGVSLPDCPGTYFPELYPQYGNDKAEMYPVSYFYGSAKSSHETFMSMNKKLITVDNPDNGVYYIPTFFISPTAMAAPYRQNNFASFLSSGDFADELRVQGWAAPNLHPNNHAHAAWGYEIYSWIKYTLAK